MDGDYKKDLEAQTWGQLFLGFHSSPSFEKNMTSEYSDFLGSSLPAITFSFLSVNGAVML